jgi:hypothetical protein
MPSNITVKVHVKPYIKKYLLHLSTNKAEPIIFPRKHRFSVFLVHSLVSKSRYEILKIIEKDNYPETYETIEIMLPWQMGLPGKPDITSKRYLSPSNEREFRKMVELWWRIFASNQIAEKVVKEKNERKESIYQFFNQLMITDDDVNPESFYRYYTRVLHELC